MRRMSRGVHITVANETNEKGFGHITVAMSMRLRVWL